MIRFLDFLTPFINELFKARQSRHNRQPSKTYKRVIAYALIALSLLSNYFLIKKVYSLTYTAYTYKEKYKEMQNFPLLLGACEEKNSILVAIIDDTLDPLRPISRPADTQIDTLAMNHTKLRAYSDSKNVKQKQSDDSSNSNKDTNSKKNLNPKLNVKKSAHKSSTEDEQPKSTIEQRRERMIEAQEKFRSSMAEANRARQDSPGN